MKPGSPICIFPARRKKGETAFNQIMYTFVKLLLILIIFISVVFVAKKYVVVTSDITDTESEIILQSILMNRNGIIYTDDSISRAYPYIIDAENFKDGGRRLENAFSTGDSGGFFGAKVSLSYLDGKPYIYKGAPLDTVYINRADYEMWHEMAEAGLLGPGAAIEKARSYYVNVVEDRAAGTTKQAILVVCVVMPNS